MTQQLDRLITIQQETVTRTPFGSVVVTWVDLDTVWARFTQQTATETFRNEANIMQATSMAAFRIRYREDVTEKMRIVHDGDNWNIQGIIEVGRRHMLDLMAERE